MKYALNLETLIYVSDLNIYTDLCITDLNFTNHTNFQSHEVVDRDSETQL